MIRNRGALTLTLLLLALPHVAAGEEEPILRTGPVASIGPLSIGKPFPPFTAKDVEGKELSLAGMRGKTVMIDFGSIFCIDCQEMAKEMKSLHEKYAASGLVIVAVVGGSRKEEVVRNFFRNLKAPYRVVFDGDSAIFDRYGIAQIPFQVVVDREGIVRALHGGRPENGVKTLGLDLLLGSSKGR
jgi:peroxiredoxin